MSKNCYFLKIRYEKTAYTKQHDTQGKYPDMALIKGKDDFQIEESKFDVKAALKYAYKTEGQAMIAFEKTKREVALVNSHNIWIGTVDLLKFTY